MTRQDYRIKRAFLIPLGIDALLLMVLLILSWVNKGAPSERIVLAFFFTIAGAVWGEALTRRITSDENGVTIRKFMKEKALAWENITHLGMMALRNKAYILMTTTRGFFVISNAYENYTNLVRGIIAHLPDERVEEEVRLHLDQPIKSKADIIAAWFAAVVLAAIIYIKGPRF